MIPFTLYYPHHSDPSFPGDNPTQLHRLHPTLPHISEAWQAVAHAGEGAGAGAGAGAEEEEEKRR
eukprot:757828-Hanusia_phi.AAC.1